jgi:glycosyltransferase involved in cell wall biosynthesis
VVDDGSTDSTADIVGALAGELQGLTLVRIEENHGKGYAIRQALDRVRGDVVAIQDADAEYDPSEIPPLLEPIAEGRADVVYGSRNLRTNPRSYTRYYYGGRFLSSLINMLYGSRLTDEATGYKLFRTEVLRRVTLTRDGFGFCPEVTCKLLRAGVSITELPIGYVPRSMEEGKKIRWWDGVEAIGIILALRLRRH